MGNGWTNKLYFGDNLDILRDHVPDESVDLIYLDPPFNSKATYNVLFAEKDGTQSRAQITAFEDTWHWGMESEAAFHELVTQGPGKIPDLIQALRSFLGTNDMMAYLVMMAQRLVELRRVLKPTGSIYLHCDPTASHYLKLVMDAVFGTFCFKNEIVWRRSHPRGQASTRFGSNHDVLLFYARDPSKVRWNAQYVPHDPERAAQQYSLIDEDGRRYQLTSLLNPNPDRPNLTYEFMGVTKVWRWTRDRMEAEAAKGRIVLPKGGRIPRYKRYLDEQEGVPVDDFWADIGIAGGTERLGYPTQKPEALLERILQASSNEGDVVLDPFAGCGTTIAVAERLNRRWIGIDITHLAVSLLRHRLTHTFGPDLSPFEVIGAPTDPQGAQALAEEDRYQFEWWALSLVDARPAQDRKKGADSGIDGVLYFFDDNSGKAKKIVVQVKSGNVKRSDIATLKSDTEREGAAIGAFVTLQEPTKPMREEAVSAGFYEAEAMGKKYPKLQIITIAELLDGKELQYPRLDVATFKKAQRRGKKKHEDLPLEPDQDV